MEIQASDIPWLHRQGRRHTHLCYRPNCLRRDTEVNVNIANHPRGSERPFVREKGTGAVDYLDGLRGRIHVGCPPFQRPDFWKESS